MRRLIGVLLATAVVLMIAYALVSSGPDVPDSSVLVVPVSGQLTDAPALDTLGQLLAPGPALPTLVLQLDKAAADPRVTALLLHIRPLEIGFAQIQELRDAMTRVREQGKPVIALLDMGSLNATRELYLASAAGQVYVVPGFLGPLAGLAGQFMHFGGFFEKLGVKVEYESVGKYKAGPETFAARDMSEPARENANELLDGLFGQIVRGIAKGRQHGPEEVVALIDDAPATGSEYVAAGLADGIADRSEVLDLAGLGEAEEVDLATYVQVDPRDLELRNGPAVGLVFAHGTIIPGDGGRRNSGFAADRVARALESAGEDPDVRAIVLRVDSGGGSALASDQLWRVLRRLREERPVVISMGNAAASGGYYLASAASAIVAQPATLTGSIGVFFLRPSFGQLYEKLDIDAEVLSRGAFASIGTSDQPFTPEQRARARSFVRELYDDFIARVSTGRDMPAEEVDRLAQGRVWLGEVALANGLVDALGGLHAAVERAKQEAGIEASVDPERRIFPGPRSLSQQIRDLMRGEMRAWLLRELAPVRLPDGVADAAALLEGEIAYLPPFGLELH